MRLCLLLSLFCLLVGAADAQWIGGGSNRCDCPMCRALRSGYSFDYGRSAVPRQSHAVVTAAPATIVRRVKYAPAVVASLSQPAAQPVDEYTDPKLVQYMSLVVHPRQDDVVFDLGCGDGRILIFVARTFGCRCVGIEISESRAKAARDKVKEAGLADLVTIYTGDFLQAKLDRATIVFVYQFEDTLRKLKPQLNNAVNLHTVCSVAHELPWKWASPAVEHQGGKFYIYRR